MDNETIKRVLEALVLNAPKGWAVCGILPEKLAVDYRSPRGKHVLMGFKLIDGGVQVAGRKGPQDIMFIEKEEPKPMQHFHHSAVDTRW